jgi:hypothetical protein
MVLGMALALVSASTHASKRSSISKKRSICDLLYFLPLGEDEEELEYELEEEEEEQRFLFALATAFAAAMGALG